MMLTWILFYLILTLQNLDLAFGCLGTNVALHKNASICSIVSIKLTDGDTEISVNSGALGCEYGSRPLINAYLGKNFSIQSVILYLGNASQNPERRALDKFSVLLGKHHNMCAKFSNKIQELPRPNKALRVNCPFNAKMVDNVFIPTADYPVHISEIEVFSFGTEDDRFGITVYRGCYKQFIKKEGTEFVDFWTCISFCWDKKLYLIGIKQSLCECGSDFIEDHLLPFSTCNVRCGSDKYYCGGKNGYSVYLLALQLPSFVSCHKLRNEPNYSSIAKNSLQNCISTCGTSYHMWIQQDKCGCVDNVSSYIVTHPGPGICDERCPGDNEVICGSSEGAHIYSTCSSTNFELLPCFKLLQCKEGLHNEHGICAKGCKPNFKGPYCIEADKESKSCFEDSKVMDILLTICMLLCIL